MNNFKRGRSGWQMLELPDGITTSNGNWYHINREGIERYLPGLLKEVELEKIVEEADAWLKSSDGLSLMLFFLLAYLSVSPLWAALAALAFYFLWYFNTSVFVTVSGSSVAKILNKDGFVYTVSGILLIGMTVNDLIAGLGVQVEFNAVWYGLGLFFLFKVGLLGLAVKYIRSKFSDGPEVSRPDRILNMLLIRYGLKSGILTGEVQQMEKELIRLANYHKGKKK